MDKIKEFREKYPFLDFLAGFIPGVGEALDAHDFSIAAKKNDYMGMGLASLGFLLPVVSGGLIGKALKMTKREAPELTKGATRITKKVNFDDIAKAFKEESGLDFGLKHWEELAKGHKMTRIEKELYTKKAFPQFIETYRDLIGNGLLKKINGKWYGHFDDAVMPNVKDQRLANAWKAGDRILLNGDTGAMLYIIVHSPQGKGKFIYNGIPMHRGIAKKVEFEEGKYHPSSWFNSDTNGAKTYAGEDGLEIFGLPIKPSKIVKGADDSIETLRKPSQYSTTLRWKDNEPLGKFVQGKNKVYMTEGPVVDLYASIQLKKPISGVITVANTPIKSAFGGSGLYDIEENLYKPFMQIAAPIGLASIIGFKTYENSVR